MDIKDFIIKELNKCNDISAAFKEQVEIKDSVDDINTDNAISANKDVVIEYLMKSGYELNQENFERAEKMLNSGKPLTRNYKTVDHLQDLSTDELNSLLNVALLNALNTIVEKMPKKIIRYEYAIKLVDRSFKYVAADKFKMLEIINEMSEKGFRVVNIYLDTYSQLFSNDKEEAVILFERPIYED